ncbi:unnamed protein product [Rangifer tarandus platyrhynchus]|uniref:Uncharacterized protein n=1 Tax=Rangifer tarandus platyrhynchus TaxID=3082113 RepID=A0AC59ZNN0_RANTA
MHQWPRPVTVVVRKRWAAAPGLHPPGLSGRSTLSWQRLNLPLQVPALSLSPPINQDAAGEEHLARKCLLAQGRAAEPDSEEVTPARPGAAAALRMRPGRRAAEKPCAVPASHSRMLLYARRYEAEQLGVSGTAAQVSLSVSPRHLPPWMRRSLRASPRDSGSFRSQQAEVMAEDFQKT